MSVMSFFSSLSCSSIQKIPSRSMHLVCETAVVRVMTILVMGSTMCFEAALEHVKETNK